MRIIKYAIGFAYKKMITTEKSRSVTLSFSQKLSLNKSNLPQLKEKVVRWNYKKKQNSQTSCISGRGKSVGFGGVHCRDLSTHTNAECQMQ